MTRSLTVAISPSLAAIMRGLLPCYGQEMEQKMYELEIEEAELKRTDRSGDIREKVLYNIRYSQ